VFSVRYGLNLYIWFRRTKGRTMPHAVSRQPGFGPRSVLVRFVVDKVSLWHVFLPVLCFLLSVSFRRWSTLNWILLLSEGQAGEAWVSIFRLFEGTTLTFRNVVNQSPSDTASHHRRTVVRACHTEKVHLSGCLIFPGSTCNHWTV